MPVVTNLGGMVAHGQGIMHVKLGGGPGHPTFEKAFRRAFTEKRRHVLKVQAEHPRSLEGTSY